MSVRDDEAFPLSQVRTDIDPRFYFLRSSQTHISALAWRPLTFPNIQQSYFEDSSFVYAV